MAAAYFEVSALELLKRTTRNQVRKATSDQHQNHFSWTGSWISVHYTAEFSEL